MLDRHLLPAISEIEHIPVLAEVQQQGISAAAPLASLDLVGWSVKAAQFLAYTLHFNVQDFRKSGVCTRTCTESLAASRRECNGELAAISPCSCREQLCSGDSTHTFAQLTVNPSFEECLLSQWRC